MPDFFAFIIWDALIGWGVWETGDHWNDSEPPAWFVALFWMIAFPILLVAWIGAQANKVKKKRQKRQWEKRIQLQKEEERLYKLRIKEEEDLRAIEEELDCAQAPLLSKKIR